MMMKVLVFVSFAAVTNDLSVSVTFLVAFPSGSVALAVVQSCGLAALGSIRLFILKLRLKKQEKQRQPYKGSRRFWFFSALIIH